MKQTQLRYLQKGQSTTEFIVVTLFVLLPLMVIVPLLGKYADIAQTTTVASRYVAFEGMVHNTSNVSGWKTDTTLANEVRSIFFSNSDLPINTVTPATSANPLWFDHRGNSLLPDLNTNITVAATISRLGFLDLAIDPADNVVNPLDIAGALNLSKNNVYSGRVNVNIANVVGLFPALNGVNPFNNLNLAVTHNTSILVDSWAAISSDQVRSRIQGAPALFPYQYSLQPVPAQNYKILSDALHEFEPQLLPPPPLPLPLPQIPVIGRVDPDIAPY